MPWKARSYWRVQNSIEEKLSLKPFGLRIYDLMNGSFNHVSHGQNSSCKDSHDSYVLHVEFWLGLIQGFEISILIPVLGGLMEALGVLNRLAEQAESFLYSCARQSNDSYRFPSYLEGIPVCATTETQKRPAQPSGSM